MKNLICHFLTLSCTPSPFNHPCTLPPTHFFTHIFIDVIDWLIHSFIIFLVIHHSLTHFQQIFSEHLPWWRHCVGYKGFSLWGLRGHSEERVGGRHQHISKSCKSEYIRAIIARNTKCPGSPSPFPAFNVVLSESSKKFNTYKFKILRGGKERLEEENKS